MQVERNNIVAKGWG